MAVLTVFDKSDISVSFYSSNTKFDSGSGKLNHSNPHCPVSHLQLKLAKQWTILKVDQWTSGVKLSVELAGVQLTTQSVAGPSTQ